jgi:hypothetical protein
MYLKINGVMMKTPKDIDVERYNLTKSGRVASGDMTMQLIAKKIKLSVSYEVLSGNDLQQLINVIDGNEVFFEVDFQEPTGSARTVTCYAGAIKYKKFRTTNTQAMNGWYWKDVDFSLIER